MIYLIWAMDENRLIGDKGRLPWHIPKDLAFFKKITKNKNVLMGHETYISLKGYYKKNPLPFGKIYVANLNNHKYEDATLINNVNSFLENREEELFVIGGKTIYELSLPYANFLYITYILKKYSGNIYLKPFDISQFKVLNYETTDGLIFTKYQKKDNV